MIREKIIGRIKALTAKTVENGATKAEMESALQKANQLALEFFISEHDLKDVEVIEKCVLKSFPITASRYDLALFYSDLAALFDCEYYYNSQTITFFGYSQDVELCGYFYALISRACLSEKDKYLKAKENQWLKGMYHPKTIAVSFIKGFLIEVSLKMIAMYIERESSIPASYDLMVLDKKAKIKKEYEELNVNVKKVKMKDLNVAKEAFENGREEGEKFKLSQGIDHATENREMALMYNEQD